MSEMSIFSIAVLIGTAGQGIARLIGKACGDISQYQPKNDYLATPEREILLQSLYSKSFASLEDQYLVNNDTKQFHENLTDDVERSAQLKAIHVISMFESVSQVEPMAFVAEKKHGYKLKKNGSAISAMKKHLITPTFDTRKLEKLAEDSEPIIRKITNDSHSLLARAEQELALKTVAESMSSLAYNVKTSGMALVASKGSAFVRAGFDRGRVKLDTTSFPGISCHTEIRRIEEELERRGLILRRLCENHMEQRRGSSVRLKDPFPAFFAERLIKNRSERKASRVKKDPEQIAHGHNNSNHANLLIQRHLQQMELNTIKEK